MTRSTTAFNARIVSAAISRASRCRSASTPPSRDLAVARSFTGTTAITVSPRVREAGVGNLAAGTEFTARSCQIAVYSGAVPNTSDALARRPLRSVDLEPGPVALRRTVAFLGWVVSRGTHLEWRNQDRIPPAPVVCWWRPITSGTSTRW